MVKVIEVSLKKFSEKLSVWPTEENQRMERLSQKRLEAHWPF